VTSLTRQTAA